MCRNNDMTVLILLLIFFRFTMTCISNFLAKSSRILTVAKNLNKSEEAHLRFKCQQLPVIASFQFFPLCLTMRIKIYFSICGHE